MKNLLWPALTGAILAATACGGGGGDSFVQVPTEEPKDGPTEPQPGDSGLDPAFDCERTAPNSYSDAEGIPHGIYFGSFYDCGLGISTFVLGMVSEDGRLRFLPYHPEETQQLVGAISVETHGFEATGLKYGETGAVALPGGSTAFWMDGVVRNHWDAGWQLQGRWGVDTDSYGTFELDSTITNYDFLYIYDPVVIEPLFGLPPGLRWLSGSWEGLHPPTGAQVRWSVTEAGELDGTDTAGCHYSGQFAIINPHYNLYDLALSIADCPLAGTYSGLGYAFTDDGEQLQLLPVAETGYLVVAVDDGGTRALSFHLGEYITWW